MNKVYNEISIKAMKIDLYNKFAPSSKAASSISLAAKTNFKKGL